MTIWHTCEECNTTITNREVDEGWHWADGSPPKRCSGKCSIIEHMLSVEKALQELWRINDEVFPDQDSGESWDCGQELCRVSVSLKLMEIREIFKGNVDRSR